MGRVKKFFVSFIPKHVGNRTVCAVYHVLTFIKVSRKVREKNYNSNIVQLNYNTWNFLAVPNAYIENQNEWGEILFGTGPHHNMKYSGCEIIATFNALKALTYSGSPESMATLISEYEAHGAALRGEFGVSPLAIEAYLKKRGYVVSSTDKEDGTEPDEVDKQSQVFIVTAYNDVNDITKQIHTVCITKDESGRYVLHNAYCRDISGAYVPSISYTTLFDAIGHISQYEVKLIYLIGITKAGQDKQKS